MRLGFDTFVIEDASKGVDVPPGAVGGALHTLAAAGILIVSSREIMP